MMANKAEHTPCRRDRVRTFSMPVLRVSLLLGLLAVAGCRHLRDDEPPMDIAPDTVDIMSDAEALYQEGQFEEALQAWLDAARGAPLTAGAEDLRNRIIAALYDQNTVMAKDRYALSQQRLGLDTLENELVPTTYGTRRYVSRRLESHVTPPGPMRKVLDTPVTMHVVGADLSTLIRAIAGDGNVNIVADQGLGADKKLDMELDNVPLREVLDYIERNFGVEFHVGESLIWVTAAGNQQGMPLETRLYRLHKGVQFHTSDWTGKAGDPNPANRNDLSFQATELPGTQTYLETLIERFVPKVEGAQYLFDKNTHTLFVRNTAANLETIEEIIDAVDISPPQVLIEARFVEASVDDLREIGIDWILDSPLVVSKEDVLIDGQWERRPASQITGSGSDGTIFKSTPPSVNTAIGEVATANQGLNLTYQGILTEPMFTAVLHALDISGKARTLSVPRVTTVNNNPAKLRHGQDLLYYEQFVAQVFQALDANGQKYNVTAMMPQGKPVLAELGFTLVAVPSVGEGGETISLLLTPTISQLDEYNYYTDVAATNQFQQVAVKLPTIQRREVQTKVVVRSGETVVMGGLIESVSTEVVHRIPILGSLPLIGALFRREDTVEMRRNLIIFVTATVISDRGESLVGGPGSSDE